MEDASISNGRDPGYSVGFTTRGNLTNPATFIQDSHGDWIPIDHVRSYDIAGNVVRQDDGNVNHTYFSYGGNSCDHSVPTTITKVLGQITTMTYDCNISKPLSSRDPNNVTTAYAYVDDLERLTQVRRAADVSGVESQTNYSYPDAKHVFTYTDQKTKADGALRADTVYDGLGRVSATVQYGDPAGVAKTDTTYDALGRTTELKTSGDGATVTTSYAGNQSTVTDQAGKKRTNTYDVLGRLTRVVEDPGAGGLNYSTSYGYDALDDLVSVTQGSQTRGFAYDAVRRLLTATNPESGTVKYTYDRVGNLVSKTDGRGTITCYGSLLGASCSSGYDELNRVTRKSYSDGTPTVTYTYDTGAAKGIGRLTKVSNANAVTQYSEFDELGRVKQSSQQTGGAGLRIFLYVQSGGSADE